MNKTGNHQDGVCTERRFIWGGYGKRFTLIELLIVIAIIAVLAALLLPALNKARERGKSISCLSNQKQVGIQFMTYTDDFKGFYPHYQVGNTIVDSSIKNSGSDCSDMWHFVLSWLYARPLKSTTLVKSIFACPSHTPDRMALMYISYGYNFANIGSSHRVDGTQTPAKNSRIRNVANVVLTAETQRSAMVGTSRSKRGYFLCKDTFTNTSSSDYTVSARHENSTNILWCDGHASAMRIPGGEGNYAMAYEPAFLGKTGIANNKWNRE